MAKFTLVDNKIKDKNSNVIPVKIVQTKTVVRHRKYLLIISIVEFIIILGMLIYG